MSTQNLIQIKRSETTQTPPSLANGELAWSSNGNVLFIGDFNTVRQVGGEFITGTNEVDVNYAANGQVTIGLANTVNFDDLDISTLTLNTYLVDDIIDDDTMASASNTSLVTSEAIKTYVDAEIGAIVSDFDVAGDSGTDTVFTGQTLTFTGDTGLTTSVSNNQVTIDLDDTAVNPATYGTANTLGQFTVDQQGRITGVTNVAIDHDSLLGYVANEHIDHTNVEILQGAGLDGSNGDITASRTISVGAGDGIAVNATSTEVAANTSAGLVASPGSLDVKLGNGLTFDGSGNVAISSGDDVTFGDLSVEGDLVVTGNVISLEVTDFKVEDPLIHLGANNVADSLDLGFVGRYSDDVGVTIEHAGLFRDADDEKFHFFKNLVDDNLDNGATTVNKSDPTYARADVVMGNLEGFDATLEDISANTLSLTTALEVTSGGTGKQSVSNNAILYGQDTGALAEATGTAYQVLQMNASGVPVFDSLDGGTF